jgi:hypothetical protein
LEVEIRMNLLLTAGCSFSVASHQCWPFHLENILQPKNATHTGLSCQGNDLISKKILYHTIQLLTTISPDDLLVGVMWSNPDRKAVYLKNPSPDLPKLQYCRENPTSVAHTDNWYILNSDDYKLKGISRLYYEDFYSEIDSYVNTCEHILRVQWFLEKHNIKYFMSTYLDEVLPKELENMPEVSYLYKQINFKSFLPVTSEYAWCRDNYGSEFKNDDNHPTPYQHEKFTAEVIIPFLKEKNYI